MQEKIEVKMINKYSATLIRNVEIYYQNSAPSKYKGITENLTPFMNAPMFSAATDIWSTA